MTFLVCPGIRRLSTIGVVVMLSMTLSACGWVLPPSQTRGNKIDPDQLKELRPGISTKADVTSLIGSPTQIAAFDSNSWLYIAEVTRSRVGRTLGLLDQEVVVLSFDDQGLLTVVRELTQRNALPVAMVSRTTPSPGTEASFMQQLLGNIGRFNPTGAGTFGGGAATPSGGL